MASAAEVAELKAELERVKAHADAKEAESKGYGDNYMPIKKPWGRQKDGDVWQPVVQQRVRHEAGESTMKTMT